MAFGFRSTHPLTEQALRNLGLKSYQVTQGWGTATASAGYHKPVGTCDGRRFSHCVDLDPTLIDPVFVARLWEAGFVAFARLHSLGWNGSSHIHAIHLGLVADDGQPHLLSGPRSQIVDFLHDPPLDGLAYHRLLPHHKPPREVQVELRRQYSEWLPDYPTRVLAPGGQQINCYAWLEGDRVTCEMDAFLRWWGKSEEWFGKTIGVGAITDHGGDWSNDGRHWRATVRELAQAIGLKIASYRFDKQQRYAVVQLAY